MTQVFRIIREHRIHHGDTEATEKSGKIDILSALSVSVVKYIFLSNRDGIDTSKRFITLKNLGDPHDLLGAKSLLALSGTQILSCDQARIGFLLTNISRFVPHHSGRWSHPQDEAVTARAQQMSPASTEDPFCTDRGSPAIAWRRSLLSQAARA